MLVACDVAEPELDAQSAEVNESRGAFAVAAPAAAPISQNYCDHADRVLRAEALKSRLEADGDLAKDRERVLLDDLRAGEAVFAGAERLVLRGADEVHVGFENGALIATAPGADAPLARLRLANGVKVHVFADGVRKIVLKESIARADIGHLIVMTDLDGAVDVDVQATPTCLVIDGGGDAAAGPLNTHGIELDITAGPRPAKATIHGTSWVDTLTGTDVSDTIYGYAGGDYIYGRHGGDYIYGNEGGDRLYGEGAYTNELNWIYGGKDSDGIDGGGTAVSMCYGDDGADGCVNCGGPC
jgi:hemolysin A